MEEHPDPDSEADASRSPSTDQIRIVGAEPAGEHAVGELADGEGLDGPDPNRFGPIPVIRVEEGPLEGSAPAEPAELPHWTQPATGEVPKVLLDEDAADTRGDWAAMSTSPRWRDQSSDWDDDNDLNDLSRLADDRTRMGALDTSPPEDPDDFFGMGDDENEPLALGSAAALSQQFDPPARRSSGSDRNMPVAIAVGVGLFVVALLVFNAGPRWTMGLVALVLGLSAAEFFESARRGGYSPATLLGLTASVGLPLAVYWKGVAAYPLVGFLSVVFSMLWYLTGNERGRTGANIGVTLLGIGYIGVLGSFAALLLRQEHGTGILLAAIVPTMAYDTFGYLVGRSAGKSALSAASPNKTVEGLVAGCLAAVVAAVLMVLISETWIFPFDSLSEALLLGAVVSVAAPFGDLSESLLKRDFGVKDMGTLLPGHGGFLDRFDGLLFVLPSVAYLVQVLGLV